MRTLSLITLSGILSLSSGCANFNVIEPVSEDTIAAFERVDNEERNETPTAPTPISTVPRQPYFPQLLEKLDAFDETYQKVDKSPLPRAFWLQEHMGDIIHESQHLLNLISAYTELEVDEESFQGDSFVSSLLFGHRRYFQTIIKDTERIEGIYFTTILEIVGRDLDPEVNSSLYNSNAAHRNRADILADLFVAGVSQKIMQYHHFDIGRDALRRRLQQTYDFIDVKHRYEELSREQLMRSSAHPVLLAILATHEPGDLLETWRSYRKLTHEEFYDDTFSRVEQATEFPLHFCELYEDECFK